MPALASLDSLNWVGDSSPVRQKSFSSLKLFAVLSALHYMGANGIYSCSFAVSKRLVAISDVE